MTDYKDAAKKAVGGVLIAAGVGVGVWASLIILDLLTFFYVYFSTANVLQDYNLPEYGAKFVAVLFAGFVAYVANNILWNMAKRNRQWVPALVGLMALWFGLMFIVSSPYENSSFNIFSGQPGKYYRDQYKQIHTVPKGAKVGPNGEEVQSFNKETAQEYERQGEVHAGKPISKNEKGFLSNLASSLFGAKKSVPVKISGFFTSLDVYVEKIQVAPDRTILSFSSSQSSLTDFFYKTTTAYLTDDQGQVYDLIKDEVLYESYNMPGPFGGTQYLVHYVRAGEVYNFTLVFAPLKSGVVDLKFHHNYWHDADLSGLLVHAERVATLPPPAPPPMVAKVSKPLYIPPPPVPVEMAKILTQAVSTEPKIGADSTIYVLKLHEGFKNIKINETFTKKVKVNRYRRPEQVVTLAGWNLNVSECTGYTMPEFSSEEVELTFFRLPKNIYLYVGEIGMIYEAMGLKPDPYALATLNEQDHTFAEKYPSMMEWLAKISDVNLIKNSLIDSLQNRDGVHHHLKFRPIDKDGGPNRTSVYCGDFTLGWAYKYDKIDWWYAGVRK